MKIKYLFFLQIFFIFQQELSSSEENVPLGYILFRSLNNNLSKNFSAVCEDKNEIKNEHIKTKEKEPSFLERYVNITTNQRGGTWIWGIHTDTIYDNKK